MTVSAAGLKGFGMQYVAANNALYDRQMFAADELAWRNNDYFNFGYWLPDTAAYEDACENLMERLLALAPPLVTCPPCPTAEPSSLSAHARRSTSGAKNNRARIQHLSLQRSSPKARIRPGGARCVVFASSFRATLGQTAR